MPWTCIDLDSRRVRGIYDPQERDLMLVCIPEAEQLLSFINSAAEVAVPIIPEGHFPLNAIGDEPPGTE